MLTAAAFDTQQRLAIRPDSAIAELTNHQVSNATQYETKQR